MKKLFLILSKIKNSLFYYIFIFFLTLIFFIPLFFYLRLPKSLNLKFFSIFDFFFKIYKIYSYFFSKFQISKISNIQRKKLNFLIKNSNKKSVFYFKLDSFEDFLFPFYLIDKNLDLEDFLYFNFLNINEYNFLIKSFLKKINELYLSEVTVEKNFKIETICKIIFFSKESELEKAKLNFENYNYFLVTRRKDFEFESEEEIFEIKNFSNLETIIF